MEGNIAALSFYIFYCATLSCLYKTLADTFSCRCILLSNFAACICIELLLVTSTCRLISGDEIT